MQTSRARMLLHVLILLFGVSAWIGVNGIFVELPLLIKSSIEGWELPAYIVILIQAGNVLPLAYSFVEDITQKFKQSYWIIGILTLGTLAMGLLTFLYDKTTIIGETEHSVALFVLTFFTALVGCSSSVIFMPYLRHFKETYLISYFIGEGLSGVLPSVLALIQGVGGNPECVISSDNKTELISRDPKFSPKYYFLFLFVLLAMSFVSFLILEYFLHNQRENADPSKTNTMDDYYPNDNICYKDETDGQSRTAQIHLLALMSVLCFFGNGFFPSILNYTCMPYGNVAYHLSITLGQFANPAACLLAFWILPKSFRTINVMFLASVLTGSYVVCLALMSPFPPLQHSDYGVAIIVIVWVTASALISYLKLSIASIFRKERASKSLFRTGIVMQSGSACGAICSFTLVKFTTLFNTYDPCYEFSNYSDL